MAGQTLSTHLDDELALALRQVASSEGRPASQVIAASVRSFLGLAPQARQVLHALEGGFSDAERDHLQRILSRQIVTAHRRIIEGRALARMAQEAPAGSNQPPLTEEDIIAEAVEACR